VECWADEIVFVVSDLVDEVFFLAQICCVNLLCGLMLVVGGLRTNLNWILLLDS